MNVLALLMFVAAVGLGQAAYPPDLIKSLPDAPKFGFDMYSGYIELPEKRRSFYYFVESTGLNASSAPLVLWLNGGPGCSSLAGLATENGPFKFRKGSGSSVYELYENPYSWNQVANVLYLESPPGVGFSKDNPDTPTHYTDDITSETSYNFLQKWLLKFPEYSGRDFYITGESYAGHYVPQLVDRIAFGSDSVLKNMLKGYMVGNPCTSDQGCGNPDPTYGQFMSTHGLAPLNPKIPSDMDNLNINPYDILVDTCPAQLEYAQFSHPLLDAQKKQVAEWKRLGRVPNIAPCAENFMTAYFNRADVQKAIHAVQGTWNMCGGVNYAINTSGVLDLYQKFIAQTKLQILVFSGTADSVVNFINTENAVVSLNESVTQSYRAWNYVGTDGSQLAGSYVVFGKLAYATVKGAGHMVPQFQPPVALELIKTFIEFGHPNQ